MNKEECLQIIRASARDRKYVTVQQEKSPSEAKYNMSGKLKSPVAQILLETCQFWDGQAAHNQ